MLDKNLIRLLQHLYERETDGADYEYVLDVFAEFQEMSRGALEDAVFAADDIEATDYADAFDDTWEIL